MTEAEWLACEEPMGMAETAEVIDACCTRRGRLFAVACCRLGAGQMKVGGQDAFDLAEGYADGVVHSDDVRVLRVRIKQLTRPHRQSILPILAFALDDQPFQPDALVRCIRVVELLTAIPLPSIADRVRDIFGNPFRPVTVDPVWLTSTVVALARQMYDARDFTPMPILADALEDAGCGDPDVLAHCRSPGPHVRGCWVVDLLLGKT